MQQKIQRAVILGSGTMGSGIAAHLANVGIPSLLLDIVPPNFTDADRQKGLTENSAEFRNRLATNAKAALLKGRSPLFVPERADLITVGNMEDDQDKLKEADWIIEVVSERLDIKKTVLNMIQANRQPGTIVSTNTSGISINTMSEDMPEEFRQHFLGTHFFNPVRYTRLLELIPGKDTLPEIYDFMFDFCERTLGKGVVPAKDTPGFIGNRMGCHGLEVAIRVMMEEGMTVEEIDAITGRAIGRAGSSTFGTIDLTGVDIFYNVAENMHQLLPEGEREAYATPEFITKIIALGWLGNKAGQGLYKRVKGQEPLALDYNTLEYRPMQKPDYPILKAAKEIKDVGQRIKSLVYSDEKVGRAAWKIIKECLLYAAAKVPEIADDIASLDAGLKMGYNYSIGPFEIWDAIGVEKSVQKMQGEGDQIPMLVKQLLEAGYSSFYQQREDGIYYFDQNSGDYVKKREATGFISLPAVKKSKGVINSNPGASLVDIGDGVACLEFHSKNNAITDELIEMIEYSVGEVSKNFAALVIANQGRNFCVGADLVGVMARAKAGKWEEVENMLRSFQVANMMLKYSPKPVVVAPFNNTMGGGLEVVLHSSQVQAHADSFLGLVETGVGLLPAGGGTKELLWRAMESIPVQAETMFAVKVNPTSFVGRAFENIIMAKVSGNALHAQRLGLLRDSDRMSFSAQWHIFDAKEAALKLARDGYMPPQFKPVKATGRDGYAEMMMIAYNLKQGGYISEYDEFIAGKVARILSGGDIEPGTLVQEEYILDLERENFMSLLGEAKTQERIQHLLETGKKLRN